MPGNIPIIIQNRYRALQDLEELLQPLEKEEQHLSLERDHFFGTIPERCTFDISDLQVILKKCYLQRQANCFNLEYY